MLVPFGEWAPDRADLGTDTLDIALNIIPGVNSWRPWKAMVSQSDALASACKGITYVQKSDGSFDTYAGTATKLYKYSSTDGSWTDVTRLVGGDYAVPTDSFWSFAQFGDLLIAVNGSDAVQSIDIGSGTNFDALGDTPPTAGFVTVVQDRVVLSRLVSAARFVAWSDINDAEAWDPGVDGLADEQEFASAGEVQAVCGSARLVIQERGLRSITPTLDTNSFQFEEIASTKGTIAPNSVIEFGQLAAWLSEDGFYIGNAVEQKNISANRITEYFFNSVYRERIWQVFAAADPFATRLYWAYPTDDTAYNDRIIGYDWSLDKWFEIEAITYVLARTATSGATLESLNDISATLEGLEITMDSRIYQGGTPNFGAIDEDLKLAYFEGTPSAATIETGNYQLNPGRRSRVTSAMPFIEGTGGSGVTVQVGKRQRLSDSVIWSPASAMQASGRCPLNSEGFLQRFRLNIPASEWTHAQGMEVESIPMGIR